MLLSDKELKENLEMLEGAKLKTPTSLDFTYSANKVINHLLVEVRELKQDYKNLEKLLEKVR